MADVQRRIENILSKVNNRICADCDAKNPRWVSLTLGVLVCIRCCGMHRNLGTHISKMKSTTLDKWLPDWCYIFECLDNAIANDHWERNRPVNLKRPTESSPSNEVERFIRDKYELKRWAPSCEDSPVKSVINGNLKKPAAPAAPQKAPVVLQTVPVTPQSAPVVTQAKSMDLLSMDLFEPPFAKSQEEEMVWHSAPFAPQPAAEFAAFPTSAPAFQPTFPSAPVFQSAPVVQQPVPAFQPAPVYPPPQAVASPQPTQSAAEKDANIRAILSMYQQPQAKPIPAQGGFVPLGAIAAEQMMRGAPGMYAWPNY